MMKRKLSSNTVERATYGWHSGRKLHREESSILPTTDLIVKRTKWPWGTKVKTWNSQGLRESSVKTRTKKIFGLAKEKSVVYSGKYKFGNATGKKKEVRKTYFD
ncbi:MAG: hypothetical protein WC602_00720 [archaeon]